MNSKGSTGQQAMPHRVTACLRGGLAVCFVLACAGLVVPVSAQEADRPQGFSEASHTQDATPDYERLFAMDRVHELHIAIAPEDFAAMQEDLRTLAPGGFGGFGGRGGVVAFGRGAPPPGEAPQGRGFIFGGGGDLFEGMAAAMEVCEAQPAGAACTAGGMEGQCQAMMGASLVCVPEAMANFAPGGRGGAPDLIPEDPIYVPVTVSYEGRTWPGVGMRYKGNSSLMTAIMSENGKVPFRLDFDRYEDEVPGTRNQRFFGFHKLTFSSNFSDDSMLKEVLATEVFRDLGVPAARAAFYRVFVDSGAGPEYWGMYTMIEDPADGAMLDSQFASGDGNLYKPDGPGANWVFFEEDGFPKKTNEDEADFSDISAAISALHASRDDPAAWRAGLEAELDVDLFLRWLAANSVIENWDSYGRIAHNYYIYSDPGDDGRLKWIPWDHNMSFGMAGGDFPGMGRGRGGGLPFEIPEGIRDLIGDGARAFMGGGGDDILHTSAGESWPLISYLLADEVYAERYRELLEESLDGLFAADTFETRARELHAMIAPYVAGDEGERPTHTTLSAPGGFDSSLDALLEQVANRREQIGDALAGSRPGQ